MDDSVQSTSSKPPTESGTTDTNGAPAVHKKRVLTWEEWMELKSHWDLNRSRFPVQQLVPYIGKIIAWEPDGSAIRESGSSHREVYDKIRAQGDDPSIYTYEDIPIL